MISLFYSILYTTAIFLVFKFFPAYKINTFQAIVINYYVCVITGIFFLDTPSAILSQDYSSAPAISGFLIGSCFIGSFNLIAYTIRKVNITVATIANKMSLIVPTLFSLLFLKTQSSETGSLSYLGWATGILAIVLASIKEDAKSTGNVNKFYMYLLPFLVFFAGGLIDTMTNYASYKYLNAESLEYFAIYCYMAAGIAGTLISLVRIFNYGEKVILRNIYAGIILGIPNYFSFYYLVKTLGVYQNNGALIFPLLNISVIVLTSLLAVLFFREKLSFKNILGILLAVISILFIFLDGNKAIFVWH